MSQIIFHIDVNSAFLSWTAVEQLKNGFELDIREIPAIIGGDQKARHGIVLAKSVLAKKFGIVTGEPIVNALRKCPEIQMFPPNHRMYSEYSARLMDFLKNYTPDIEQVSVDECYMDFTPIRNDFSSPIEAATIIKNGVRDTFGFTVNIGISDRKILAKMASDFKKPDLIHTLYSYEIQQKMWPLPVRDLFLVGAATEAKLHKFGIYTIGDLAKADVSVLRRRLGKHGETIWHFANGRNADLVTPTPAENKGYGNSVTTATDVVTREQAHQVLLGLCETVAARMRKDDKCGGCVTVHLRTSDFHHFSHQSRLHGATNNTGQLFKAACRVFDEAWDGITPLRQLGVQMTHLSAEPYQQYDLFSGMSPVQFERKLKLDETVDALRDKFGEDIIRRAKFAKDPDGHMTGGLDKARRTGVTKPVPEEK